MVETNQMAKFAAIGVGAIAIGAMVWYLSRDDETLNYKRYTKQRLEKLMTEMELEFTCIYARNYNLML